MEIVYKTSSDSQDISDTWDRLDDYGISTWRRRWDEVQVQVMCDKVVEICFQTGNRVEKFTTAIDGKGMWWEDVEGVPASQVVDSTPELSSIPQSSLWGRARKW